MRIHFFVTKTKVSSVTLPIIITAFLCLLLLFPEHYFDATLKGLVLFSKTVLPTIFPFVFLSTLLSNTKAVDRVNVAFEKPIKKLFGAKKEGAFVLVNALLSGYPIGALTTASLFGQGHIDSDDAKCFVTFTSTVGPMYVLGTVGGLFDSPETGVVILASHYLGTLVNGIFWRCLRALRARSHTHAHTHDNIIAHAKEFSPCSTIDNAKNFSNYTIITHKKELSPCTLTLSNNSDKNILGDAVVSAVSSMLTLGGYIVLFGLVVDTLTLLPFWEKLNPVLQTILVMPIEMTRGVMCASTLQNKVLSVALATFSVTFGGISIFAQHCHYLKGCGCGFFDILLPKISQGVFATIFSIIFFNIFFNFLA